MSPFLRLSRPKAPSTPYRVVRRTDRTIFTDHTPLRCPSRPHTKTFRWPSSRHSLSIRGIGSWTDNKMAPLLFHPSFADVSQSTLPSLWPSRMSSFHASSPAVPNRAGCVNDPININIDLNWIVAESPKEMTNESTRTHQGYCMICRACSLSALSYRSNPLAQSAHAMELYLYFPFGSNRGHRVSPPVPMALRVQIPNQGPPVS